MESIESIVACEQQAAPSNLVPPNSDSPATSTPRTSPKQQGFSKFRTPQNGSLSTVESKNHGDPKTLAELFDEIQQYLMFPIGSKKNGLDIFLDIQKFIKRMLDSEKTQENRSQFL